MAYALLLFLVTPPLGGWMAGRYLKASRNDQSGGRVFIVFLTIIVTLAGPTFLAAKINELVDSMGQKQLMAIWVFAYIAFSALAAFFVGIKRGD